ncbi:MAG: nucleotidyl transferase AbiEii/AbiGii toxin family protein [Treponema sp.]|nr:nucleotidyl transferase AbiEii/AbiGii toxin family protein [Treponema sp.]
MDFLHNDKTVFLQAVNLVTAKNGIRAEIVEKDYYVTVILRLLSERLPFIVFKGGTSLSKCYGAIKRFSEDIDVTIDTTISQGQKKKVKDAVVEIAEILGLSIPNIGETRSRRDYNRYEIAYEPVQSVEDYAVQPRVILETSYTAVSFPTVLLPVRSYIGDMMKTEAPDYIEQYGLKPFTMKVQGLDRTLADKVFAICDYYLQGKTAGHSRHLYDIYKLLPLVPQNEDFKKLVQEVRIVRSSSPVCPSAQSDVAIPALLEKIIAENAYKADYTAVTEKLLEETVGYEQAIGAVKTLAESGMFEFLKKVR